MEKAYRSVPTLQVGFDALWNHTARGITDGCNICAGQASQQPRGRVGR